MTQKDKERIDRERKERPTKCDTCEFQVVEIGVPDEVYEEMYNLTNPYHGLRSCGYSDKNCNCCIRHKYWKQRIGEQRTKRSYD